MDSIKKIFAIVIFMVLVLISVNVFAWTTYPFRVGWSDVYTSGGEHWQYFHTTSVPIKLRNSRMMNKMYRYSINVAFTRRVGKEDFLMSSRPISEEGKIIMKKLSEDVIKILQPIYEESGAITIGYCPQMQSMNIFLHPKYNKDRLLYLKIANILNKERDRLIATGEYIVNQRLKESLDSMEGR